LKTKLASHITIAAVGITVLLTLSSAAHAQQASDGSRAPHRRSLPATDGTTTMMADGQAGTSAPAAGAAKKPVRAVVNINTATAQQLAYLPEIGPKTAARIIEYRTEHGMFKALAELQNVKGIGPKTLVRVMPFAVLSGKTTAKAKIKPGK
jgi:comEA protein